VKYHFGEILVWFFFVIGLAVLVAAFALAVAARPVETVAFLICAAVWWRLI
jgi:hypothetical protein